MNESANPLWAYNAVDKCIATLEGVGVAYVADLSHEDINRIVNSHNSSIHRVRSEKGEHTADNLKTYVATYGEKITVVVAKDILAAITKWQESIDEPEGSPDKVELVEWTVLAC